MCASTAHSNGKRRFHLVVERELLDRVEEEAQRNMRTLTAEIKQALIDRYLKEKAA